MKPDLITTDCCNLTERELGQSVCFDEGRLSDAKFGADTPDTPVTPPASPRPPLPTRLADEDLQESWWSLELQTVTQTWPGGGLQRLLVQWTFVTSRCLENSNYKYRNSIEIYFRWCSWNACSSQLQWYNHKQYYQVCQLQLNNALEWIKCLETMSGGRGMTPSSLYSRAGRTPGWCSGQYLLEIVYTIILSWWNYKVK